MKEPPLPCETTTSGSLSPLTAQSFTPGRVKLPKTISPGGSEQGYHIAPLSAGPAASAGTSMNRKPAASASPAVRQRASATRNLAACISRSSRYAMEGQASYRFRLSGASLADRLPHALRRGRHVDVADAELRQ